MFLKIENYKRGRKKKKPEYFICRKQLQFYLDNTDLTIDEISKRLGRQSDIVRGTSISMGCKLKIIPVLLL